MATYNPEMQFLQSMEGGPSEPVKPADGQPDEEDDDYDPSSFVATHKESASSTSTLNSKPAGNQSRFKAGFEIDDDDEDEGDGGEHIANHSTFNGTASAGETSSSGTAANAHSIHSPDVSIPKTDGQSVQESSSLNVPASSQFDARASSTPKPLTIPKSPSSAQYKTAEPSSATAAFFQRARLPQDRVGMLEDRIAEDPRGDTDAWLELIAEHRSRNRIDQAREVYQRFFSIFPTAVTPLISYARMELELDEVARLEKIFQDHLMSVPDVRLWVMYLNHVRRHQNLTTDATGTARTTITKAYRVVLDNLGVDKDAGFIWRDYIHFLQSAPGTVGGTTWEDGQKMDSVRKAYREATAVPTKELQSLWKDYNGFEHGLSQHTARKLLTEYGSTFIDAKQAMVQIENMTERLDRSSVPRLPPVPGFEGDIHHQEQVDIWRKWIAWEKSDPLLLRSNDPKEYEKRVLHVLKQATIWMRFEPEFWTEAAEFCYINNQIAKGDDFLDQGIAANPESCLLAFKKADRLESAPADSESDTKRGSTVREPYDVLLKALYKLIEVTHQREEKSIARVRESHSQKQAQLENDPAENEEDQEESRKILDTELEGQIKAIQTASKAQEELVRKLITSAWIALMRAMRRIQGKGKIDDKSAPGMRGIFVEARRRGRLNGDFYSATAWMEHHCYGEAAAGKIFQRGSTLFQEDENFALEHIKYLITVQDLTNARVAFASIVSKLTKKRENVPRAKKLYLFFHDFESKFGELSQVASLEHRMAELFPEDPRLSYFARRFEQGEDKFDPTTIRPVISVIAQMRPKLLGIPQIMQTPDIDRVIPVTFSPRPSSTSPRPAQLGGLDVPTRNSPKRPFLADSGDESFQPRKLQRGESPLKGAAGRRLDAARRRAEGSGQAAHISAPPWPADISFFLMALPKTELCANVARLNTPGLMGAIGRARLEGQGGAAPSAGYGFQQR